MKTGGERVIATVPRWVLLLLAIAFCAQVTWQALQPPPSARAEALGAPMEPAILRALALGESIALAQLLTLNLQAFDNQPGVSVPFLELDYARVTAWLVNQQAPRITLLELAGQSALYVALLAAATMFDFYRKNF